MRNKFASLVLTLGLACANAGAEQDTDTQDWMDSLTTSGEVLGMTVMQLEGDDVVHLTSGVTDPGGPEPTSTTQFQIGSITKVMTNLLLAEAVAQDVVTYSTTVGEVLGNRIQPENPAVREITFLQLATHTSGLPRLQPNFAPQDPLDPYANLDLESRYTGVNQTRAKQPLGSHYAYSNFGMGLAGHMLGLAYATDYASALQKHVLLPLGLDQTSFVAGDNRAVGFSAGGVVPAWTFGDASAAAGALWGSTADFERFARVLLGQLDYPFAHDPRENRQIETQTLGGFGVTRVWHVAYVDESPVFWHNGGTGGYTSFFGFRPDTGQAVAILISGNHQPLQKGLELLGAEPKDPPAASIDSTLFGEYQLTPEMRVGVFERNGRLATQLSGQQALGLTPLGDDWYVIDSVDASLHFVRAETDVTAIELAQGGIVQRAPRIADVARSEAIEEVDLGEDELAAFVGEFAINANAKFTIRLQDGALEAQLTGQPFLPIFAAGDDVFFYKIVDAQLLFERDSDGEVSALTLKQGAINQRAERIN